MQVWPRKRAKKQYPRVRSNVHKKMKDAKLSGFAGYKAGMTRVLATDNKKTSRTKGEQISIPVTVIECPPMKIATARFYKPAGYGTQVTKELFFKTAKELSRKIDLPKKPATEKDLEAFNPEEYEDITVTVYTQPKLTGKKKTPEIFELGIGGNNSDKISFIKENLGKEITIADVFGEGEQADIHAITKGKGYQGPVKRLGIGLTSHKSEKGRRTPGSLGGWKAQGHFMYRIAHAGQTGYHQRTHYNNPILKIGEKGEEVNPEGGFVRYGLVKNNYVLIKGSVPGPKKRLIVMTKPIRKTKEHTPPTINKIITESQQGA